jgi:stress-induced-phosphoprotein 1
MMAEQEKNLGNEQFKAGNFEGALQHYNRAIELDPQNVLFYSNKATALSKLNRHEEAVEICNECIKIGRAHGASYESIAKCYNKIAAAECARNNLEAAIDALNASVLEKTDPNVKRELKRVSDLLAKRKAKEYENPELAEKAKQEGNEFFKKADYPAAIDKYSEAIKRQPNNPFLYSNRAAAYSKLAEMPSALADCDRALEIDPNFIKAYTRKGYCHFIMKEYHKALENYQKALNIDPNNADALDGQNSVNQAIAQQRYTAPDEQQIKRAMADPEIQRIVQDPGIQQILKDIQENPQAAASHLFNPKVRDVLLKLQAAGILR